MYMCMCIELVAEFVSCRVAVLLGVPEARLPSARLFWSGLLLRSLD